eukprot:5874808-Amphidinium_carterae.1
MLGPSSDSALNCGCDLPVSQLKMAAATFKSCRYCCGVTTISCSCRVQSCSNYNLQLSRSEGVTVSSFRSMSQPLH